MRSRVERWPSVFVAALCLTAAGCGPGGPTLYGVSGVLTIGGSPAQNVQVTFMPTDASLPVASGTVDASGKFTLVSGNENRAGAAAGSYKVVLTQLDGGSQEDIEARYSGGGGGAPPIPKASFPEEYRAADTSPKQVEVVAGTNTIDIDIP